MVDFSSILAKSKPQVNLYKHTMDVVNIALQLQDVLPKLPEFGNMPNFFEMLFLAAYMHDWGKVHHHFQKKLNNEDNSWNNQRHEQFSAVFVDTLDLPNSDLQLLNYAILAHHKSFEKLSTYVFDDNEKQYLDPEIYDFTTNIRNNIFRGQALVYLKALQHMLVGHYQQYFPDSYRPFKKISLQEIDDPFEEINQISQNLMMQYTFMIGALKICDHTASANVMKINCLQPKNFGFIDKISPYQHQENTWKSCGNTLLTAPTGTGKTEAALGWIKQQLQLCQGRIYYILPYTSSINAMYVRLMKNFDTKNTNKYVGLMHGRVESFLASITDDARNLKKLMRMMFFPLKVTTPFQVLKYFYSIKGFELGITELAGSILVFDEIHAYDVTTFARIVAMLEWMKNNLGMRVLVMTATLPTFMKQILSDVLEIQNKISAPKQLLENLVRHKIKIVSGTIFDQLEKIRQCLRQGLKVLVVCNTVHNAQLVFSKLQDEFPGILLHSRFNGRDRAEIERFLQENDDVKLLVGTQTIEVCLDIDFDALFTEPPPLDALIQRLGRVNRYGKKDTCPIFVCSKGGLCDHYIYPPKIVSKTMQVLSKLDIIAEQDLQKCLDMVYPRFDEEQEKEYQCTKNMFADTISRMNPFKEHQENEQEFYDQFTNTRVLPAMFLKEYKGYIRALNWIEAENLLVSIADSFKKKLEKRGQIENQVINYAINDNIYKHKFIVAKCKYSNLLGLIEEFEDFYDDDIFL